MDKPLTGKTISCKNCGNPTMLYPPSPEYVTILLERCSKGDSIEVFFECYDCKDKNTIFWDIKHLH